MKPPEPVIIVLAAGMSRRFGTQNKLLIDWDGEPLIRRVVRTALASTPPPGPLPAERRGGVIVVTGHEASEIEDALEELPITFARNARYEEGMGTSIAAGVCAASAGAAGFLFIPGDMPRLRPETLAGLVEAGLAEASPSQDGVIVTCRATWGRTAPSYFNARYRSELEALHGDEGARILLRRHPDHVVELLVDDAEVSDID